MKNLHPPGWAIYVFISCDLTDEYKQILCSQRNRILEQLVYSSKLPLLCEYHDRAKSSDCKKPNLARLIKDAEAGHFSHLGLCHLNQFSQNVVEGIQLCKSLIESGIKVRISEMPSLKPEEADGFFCFVTQLALVQRDFNLKNQQS